MAAYRGVFRTWLNNYNEFFFVAKILNGFKLLAIFAEKGQSQMFDWVENRLLQSVWNIELTLVPRV